MKNTSLVIEAALVILVWGMTFASTRALLADFSALEIMIARFALAWCALSAYSLARRQWRRGAFCLGDELLLAGMGLTGVAFYQFMENCAIYYTNASNVAILVSFGPIVTAILARIVSKDKSLSISLVLGSLLAVLGVAMTALNGAVEFHLRPIGDIMTLSAMASWGIYTVLLDRMNRRGLPQQEVVRRSFFWSLVFLMPLAAWGVADCGYYALDGSFSITLDADINCERFARLLNWLNIGFLGILASAASFIIWNKVCKSLGIVRTTIGLYLTPIVGVAFAVLFLGERLTAMSVAGGVAILAGVIIANRSFSRRKP